MLPGTKSRVNQGERSIVWGIDRLSPRYCTHRRNVLVQRWPARIVSMPCGNIHCSVECYKWWARMLSACLRRSWEELPPDATARVTAFGLDETDTTKAESRFVNRLRRRGVSYAWFREWSSTGQRHLHLAIRGPSVDLAELWRQSLGTNGTGTTYAAPVRNLIGLARYLPGDCDKSITLPPAEVRFIFGADRRFLVRPLAALKREVRAAWRANKQAPTAPFEVDTMAQA